MPTAAFGRSVAVYFAKEGAHVVVVYLNEHDDARETQQAVEALPADAVWLIAGDIRNEQFCHEAVQKTLDQFGKLDILVNNAAVQYLEPSLQDIDAARLGRYFCHQHFFDVLLYQGGYSLHAAR